MTDSPDPFDVATAKACRSAQRGKVTKALKGIERLILDDVNELRPAQLQRKLDIIQAAIQDEMDAQQHLLKSMSIHKASEAEIQKEVDGSMDREMSYEEHIDKIVDSINMGNLLLHYQEPARKVDTWLDHATPSTTGFSTTGDKLTQEFEALIWGLTPYSTHSELGPLLPKAKALLERLLVTLTKAAPALATPAAAVAAAPAASMSTHKIV